MSQIFKAYDIRGIYPNQLNEEIIYKIGRAFAEIISSEKKKNNLKFVVGRDMRISSPNLTKNLIKGIIDQGIDVIDIGLASTPTFYFGVSLLNADGGMQVSASHNPKEYNGVKIVREKAFPVGYDNGINIIEEKVKQNNFSISKTKGNVFNEYGILEKEVDFSIKQANVHNIASLKVVADPANSMGAPYLQELFSRLPIELIKMNFELDGTFPAHEADPFKEKNILDLRERVLAENASLGIATDGDGDRVFFVDEKGELVEPAILRGIMSKLVLKEHPGATICYDIRPGKITKDMILRYGGKPLVTRVGHSIIKAQAIKENAAFAGESSGHYFFNTEIGMFEMPMIVILKLLGEIFSSNQSLNQIVKPLRKYFHSGEINSVVKDQNSKITELSDYYKDAKISFLDGITVEYDNFWFNVRPSNTEPLLRLNLEAISKEVMDTKLYEVLSLIKK